MTALQNAAPPTRTRTDRIARRRGRLGLILSLPAFVLLALFFIWPLVRTVVMSLHDWPLLGVPKFTGLENYFTAFHDANFLKAAGFTLLYTVVTTPILIVLAFLLAFLVRGGTRAHRFFQTIYFLPVVIGLASGSYIWLFMWQSDIGPTTVLLGNLGLIDPTRNFFAEFGSAGSVRLTVDLAWRLVS